MIKIGHFGGFEKFACLMFVSCLRSTFDVRREPHARREPTWTGAKFWRELSCFIVGAYGSRRGTGHKPRSRFTVSSLRLDLETTCIDVGKWFRETRFVQKKQAASHKQLLHPFDITSLVQKRWHGLSFMDSWSKRMGNKKMEIALDEIRTRAWNQNRFLGDRLNRSATSAPETSDCCHCSLD